MVADPDGEVLKVVDRLIAAHPDLPRADVEVAVQAEAAVYVHARVRTYLAILIERGARARLDVERRGAGRTDRGRVSSATQARVP
jgi:hypothetical protein